jgi:hypothetical protein
MKVCYKEHGESRFSSILNLVADQGQLHVPTTLHLKSWLQNEDGFDGEGTNPLRLPGIES